MTISNRTMNAHHEAVGREAMKKKTRYFPSLWFDQKANAPKYGIQAISNGVRYNCAESGIPLLFDTEEERDAKLKQLSKKP